MAIIAEFVIMSLILMFVAYFVVVKVVQPKLKARKQDNTLIDSLHDSLEEAQSRRARADREMEGMSWTHPDFVRWNQLRIRANADVRRYEDAIEEYHIQQEEERMLNGS